MARRDVDIFVVDRIGPRLDFMAATVAERVADAMYEGAAEIEAYAKYNAPWADRTGNAREGLTADVRLESGEIVLELSHSVSYGIWLETIQNGAYAIIMPTLEALGPQVLRRAGGQVMEVGGF